MSKIRIKILLADDTLIAREGWKKILESENDMVVIGEAITAGEVQRKVDQLRPDVLLMDLKWFGDETAGRTAIRGVKAYSPAVKIIAFSAFEELIRDARSAGADSALLKTFTRQELLDEIRAQALPLDEASISHSPISIREGITDRELHILRLMGAGHRDKEIAELLGIAHTTAKHHAKNILQKLDAKNRTQAVDIARKMGLLHSKE